MLKKPDWLRVPYSDDQNSHFVTELLDELNLNTVCIEANCPNRAECFASKSATFMILGRNCTRKCSFCNVKYAAPEPVDVIEPMRVANAVKRLGLRYVVITSVTRDDLPDGGAGQFAQVIREMRKISPETTVEVLIPDLSELKAIIDEVPTVISHNIETVASLYADVRQGADYRRSLDVLKNITLLNPEIYTKSGMMLGLGESRDEVLEAFDDLLEVGCRFLTIGQYLSPTKNHYPVKEYIHPQAFDEYADIARKRGFRHVASAPFVRSSYKADKAVL